MDDLSDKIQYLYLPKDKREKFTKIYVRGGGEIVATAYCVALQLAEKLCSHCPYEACIHHYYSLTGSLSRPVIHFCYLRHRLIMPKATGSSFTPNT